MTATNRQKKLLTFFGIRFSPNISTGAAGWEIGAIMEDEKNRERWRRYLFLTRDFDSDSPILAKYDPAELEAVNIPEDWSASDEMQKFHDEIVGQEMSGGAPFDDPAPSIDFAGHSFMFTGKFEFGTRKACQNAVTERGGSAPSQKSVSREIDYLVIGSGGSKAWKRGSYGNKIEAAVLSRREHGSPAIVSEEHWSAELTKG
jgi:NAD-dependent DNA ligase